MDFDPTTEALASPRTAVILAAGMGTRLAGEELPKPLRPVAGVPLLQRGLTTLRDAGIERVVIIVGYGGEAIRDWAARTNFERPELVWVYNPAWKLSNGLSALHARLHVPESFLLLMADHVMTPGMIRSLSHVNPPAGGAVLMVDPRLESVFDMDDATKVQTDGSTGLVAIGKILDSYDAVDTGLFHCTRGLFSALEAVYAERGDASLSAGMQALAAADRMRVAPIPADDWWQDVDTPEALAEAERRLGA